MQKRTLTAKEFSLFRCIALKEAEILASVFIIWRFEKYKEVTLLLYEVDLQNLLLI